MDFTMDFFESLIRFFDTTGEVPALFGPFHLVSLALTLLATIAACVFGRKASARAVRRIVLSVAIVVVLLEVYKQLTFTFDVTEEGLVGEYLWYAFPWQFCSTPMYVGLLAGLTKKGKLHETACAYLATFAVFAGLAVMIYPGNVYIETVGINFQTMICHGTMIPVGALLYASGHVKRKFKTVLKAVPLFLFCVLVAMILNEVAYQTGLTQTGEFNMFYFSPYQPPSLPVYSLVQQVVPYPASLIIYVGGFTLAAFVILLIAMGIGKLFQKRPAPTAV